MRQSLHIHRLDRNTWLGIAAILLWSSTVALARSISEQVGPLTASCTVYLTAGLLLGTYHLLKERSFPKLRTLPPRYVFGCGALFLIYTVAVFLALGLAADRYQTVEVGLLNYLWPTLTILFSLFIVGNKAQLGLIPGTLLALLGVLLVLTQGTTISWDSFSANLLSNPTAYSLGIAAAVSWGLYSNLARRWGPPDGGGAVLMFILGTGIIIGLVRLLHAEAGTWDARVLVEIIFLGLATALAYVFWDMAMRGGDMVLVAACSYFTPFLSTVVSSVYLGVLPGLNLWVGCVLLVGGAFLSWRSVRPPLSS